MKNLTLLFLLLASLFACKPAQKAIQTRTTPNAVEVRQKPHVILVSIDGYRHDYTQKYQATNIAAIAREGISAKSMIPSFPSSTFPNHYTLVTGMYPGNHGLISNTFIDPEKGGAKYRIGDRSKVTDGSWYGGTPLWVLAEKQGMRTASFFWVGSEADIQHTFPTWYYIYNGSIKDKDRVNQVVKWLKMPEETRPHLITLYFSKVDSKGHRYGPDSPEVAEAVKEVDEVIGDLYKKVRALDIPVNLILTSDHGMQEVDRDNPLILRALTDLSNYEEAHSSSVISILYAKDKDPKKIEATYQELKSKANGRYRIYRSAEMPDSLAFPHTPRTGDLVIFANAPNAIGAATYKPSLGCHGFDPYSTPDIETIFYANGPAFKRGEQIPSFQNVHVFPLIAEILGLKYDIEGIDGDVRVLKGILKE